MSQDAIRFNWLFIDMNSFFASAEQHLRPELRGRMVGVIPVQSEESCVIAASADAKRMGVKVGTRVREARRLCPEIVLVKARPALYVTLHQAIGRSIDRCAPIHKVYSIDEWAIRLVDSAQEPDHALELARRIKREILRDFSPWLMCSIGIAQTRLLAKIASDMRKPDGLTTLHTSELPARLEDHELDDLPGIAQGLLSRLHAAGIRTVRQLWDLSPQQSRKVWGSVQGEYWWHGFHGHDMPEPPTRRRSINRANMLPPEHRDDAGAHAILVRLLCNGAQQLRHEGYVAHSLHIHVRTYNRREWQSQTALEGTQDTLTIVRLFESMWSTRPWASRESEWRPFAKVAITLSGLTALENVTPLLFQETKPLTPLSRTMDRINSRWGRNTVYLGSIHNCRHEMEDKIAFGRIPNQA
jgi:DNA polymerase-4